MKPAALSPKLFRSSCPVCSALEKSSSCRESSRHALVALIAVASMAWQRLRRCSQHPGAHLVPQGC